MEKQLDSMTEQELLSVFNTELNYSANNNHSYIVGYMRSLMVELISIPEVSKVIKKEIMYLERLNKVHNETREPR